ncbi:MAG: four helix bundle protein [Thermodesulfobacteriota bacterium]|nr:four helix bundle protein [Thermodesulfobacteriota bacterium]
MTESPIIKHCFDLEKRTLEFAKNVIKLCKQLPQNVINRELIAQLVNASGSVGANYREANDALSKKDFKHRIKITRKEAKETHYWLELLIEANPEFKENIDILLKEALELKKIFSSIANRST